MSSLTCFAASMNFMRSNFKYSNATRCGCLKPMSGKYGDDSRFFVRLVERDELRLGRVRHLVQKIGHFDGHTWAVTRRLNRRKYSHRSAGDAAMSIELLTPKSRST